LIELVGDPSQEVQDRAIETLSGFNSPEAKLVIAEAVKKDPQLEEKLRRPLAMGRSDQERVL